MRTDAAPRRGLLPTPPFTCLSCHATPCLVTLHCNLDPLSRRLVLARPGTIGRPSTRGGAEELRPVPVGRGPNRVKGRDGGRQVTRGRRGDSTEERGSRIVRGVLGVCWAPSSVQSQPSLDSSTALAHHHNLADTRLSGPLQNLSPTRHSDYASPQGWRTTLNAAPWIALATEVGTLVG